jgi:hypothetical protein
MNIIAIIKNKLNIRRALRSPSVRAKFLGLFFMGIGAYLMLFKKDPVLTRIGFGAVFIGAFTFIIIADKAVPKKLNDAQMLSNMELLYSLTTNLKLKGNGIYIPARGKLSKERVFIPTQEKPTYHLPKLNDEMVFIPEIKDDMVKFNRKGTGKNNSNPNQTTDLGGLFIPPGLELLDTYEKEIGIKVKNIDINELDQYLKVMIHGLDLVNDLSIKKDNGKNVRVKIKHSGYKEICTQVTKDMGKLSEQTGCPICSSVLCAVTRSLGKEVRILQAESKENEISYLLGIGG